MLVLEFLLDAIGHRTARLLLPVLSLGRVEVDDLLSSRTGFNWFGLRNDGNGKVLISAPMAGSIGLLFWLLLLIALLALR